MSDFAKQLFEQTVSLSKAHGYDIVSKEAGKLRYALKDLLEQVDCLDGVEFSKDLDPNEAENNWLDAIANARKALR